jgi:hypothetical protein
MSDEKITAEKTEVKRLKSEEKVNTESSKLKEPTTSAGKISPEH